MSAVSGALGREPRVAWLRRLPATPLAPDVLIGTDPTGAGAAGGAVAVDVPTATAEAISL